MRRIAHISDLHFFRIDPAVVDALAVELNNDPPDLIALSGDLHHARQVTRVPGSAGLPRPPPCGAIEAESMFRRLWAPSLAWSGQVPAPPGQS